MSKYTINLSPELEAVLNELAARQGVTKSAVIRRAVGLMKYLADERAEGARVVVESDDRAKELVFEDDLG